MNVLWDGDDNASVRSRFARTVDPQGAVKRLEPFHDALKAEVPLFDAWTGGRIESATVVRDGKEQMGTFDAAGDLDCRGSPMADCVDRQFADDAEDREGRAVRECRTIDVEDFFFDGLSAVDATYIAYVFRCKNMGDRPKTFAFRNLSVPHVSGRDNWRLAGQTNGVSVAVLNDPAKWLNTSNCRVSVTNLYLAGQRAAAFSPFAVAPKDASILDLSVVTDEALPRTVALVPDRVEVNWTCPDKRKVRLPPPRANLLEDRPATRSIWQRCPSWSVKLDACTRDEKGAVVYRLRQCEKWAGMQAVLTERVKAAGFGKYRLTFEAKATSETPFTLRVSAITNEKRNLVHMEGDRSGAWKAYAAEIDLAFDPQVTDLVALMLSVSTPVDELCFRNFRLTKAQDKRPLRVLAIGNSYTQSLHPEFANVARAAGCDLDLTIFAIGGNSLSNHFVNAVAALTDPTLRPYWVNGRKANLLDVLAEKTYDVVVLQEQSAEGMGPKMPN